MHKTSELEIQVVEEKLKIAMLNSDIAALDELLASDLIFINHLGQVITKEDDLKAHQSGLLKIENIQLFDQKIRRLNDVAVVTVKARILGCFNRKRSENEFRFTRVWCQNSNNQWNVIVAHSSQVA